MAVTLDSNTNLLPAAAFLLRADLRVVADLVSDTGNRATGTVPDADALAANTRLLAALADATGELEGACLTGQRYTATNLAQIAAATGTGAQGRLYRLLTRLAKYLLWERRLDKGDPPKGYDAVLNDLKDIREGNRIFGTIEHEEAGLLVSRVQTPEEVTNLGGVAVIAERFFGVRGDRRRAGE